MPLSDTMIDSTAMEDAVRVFETNIYMLTINWLFKDEFILHPNFTIFLLGN